MRANRARRYAGTSGLIAIAGIVSTVAAQTPLRTGNAVHPPLSPVPGAPVLVNPADGHRIQASSGVPTQIFTWDAPPAAPTPDLYTLHFEDADDPSGFRAGSTRRLFSARRGPPAGGREVRARQGFTAHFEVTSSP